MMIQDLTIVARLDDIDSDTWTVGLSHIDFNKRGENEINKL